MLRFGPADPQARVLFDEFSRWPIFDPHSHINPQSPAARELDDLLAYHYYTELAHSSGMPAELADHNVPKAERLASLAGHLERFDNTVQHAWLAEITSRFHNFDQPLSADNVQALASKADHTRDGTGWDQRVWETTNLEAVLLTNDFDDRLEGWDTRQYIPCLRTDDIVLRLHDPNTAERLRRATGIDVGDEASLRLAIGEIFAHFASRGARAVAISLPPDFAPRRASPKRAVTPLRRALHGMELRPDEHDEVRCHVFWMIAEFCAEFRLPFDLMIGPIRNIYPAGVAGGRDLFDRRTSLAEYRDLFNAFPRVSFPISTLAPDAAAELVAYAWIFPNVLPMGHWWYSNVPAFIKPDLAARLQAVPKTKLLGYYSDAYKLEFVLPKFNMYRQALAEVLANEGIKSRGWSESRSVDVARSILLENPRRLFGHETNAV